jgi:hypothetical protein
MKGFTIPATFELDHGDLVANNNELLFLSNDRTQLVIPYVKLDDVRFIHSKGPDHLVIKSDGVIHDCTLDQNEDENEFFYHHIKERLISNKEVDDFMNEKVSISKPFDKVMFGQDTMSWIFDCKPKLYKDELIQAALVGRMASDFSHHYNGVLYLTSKRIMFYSGDNLINEELLDDVKSCHVIYVDNNFSDSRGRKSYSVEINENGFNVGIQTSKQFKIEAFYHHFDPEILKIDKF